VKLRDAKGVLFLEVPEVDLSWRPLKFCFTGLDVRHLVLHRGTLYARARAQCRAIPEAPILPDFDIRVDRPGDRRSCKIARGLLGEERTIDFRARADVRDGRVLLDANGALGGGDTLKALVDAYPDATASISTSTTARRQVGCWQA
jgi:translocation and assembly module TamB